MKNPLGSFLTLSACLCLLSGSLFGQGIVRVKDVNAQVPSASSFATDTIANVNGTLFLATDDNLSGAELWKSDGTLGGTVLVRDIVPGPEGSRPEQLTAVGTGTAARLFFVVTIGAEKFLWMSDGTRDGTKPVTDGNVPAFNFDSPNKLLAFGNSLFFEADDSKNGREPWMATLGGSATLLKNINTTGGATGTNDSNINNFRIVGNTLYFTASDGATGNELWRTEGTAVSTVLVKDIVEGLSPSSPQFLSSMTTGGQTYVFFAAQDDNGREVWRTQGASATTELFMDIELQEGSSDPQDFTQVGNNLFFSAKTTAEGRELWLTDGISVKPAAAVRNIKALTEDSNPSNLISIKVGTPEILLFTADDGSTGVELWRSDGTFANTVRVNDIATGVDVSSNPSNFVKFGPTTVLFTATDAANVLALWKCEGGTGSLVTSKVMDLPPAAGATTATIRGVTLVEGTPNKIYFMLNVDEFWQSNGTAAGTTRIKRFFAGDTATFTGNSNPADFTPHDANTAFFSADDGLTGRELWKTDGTDAGTTRLSNLFVDTDESGPEEITSAGTQVFFTAVGSGTDRELWRTDGVAAPELVRNISPGGSSNPQDLHWCDPLGYLFFFATNGTNGRELWRSDGTLDGTIMIRDMNTSGDGQPSAANRSMVTFQNKLFFVANAFGTGVELYSTTGAADNVSVIDIASTGSSSPEGLVVMKDKSNITAMYFAASGGLQAGSGGGAFSGKELWKSDGTEAGTVRVKDILAGSSSSSPKNLTVAGKTLFFTANSSSSGVAPNVELWKSDGVVDGTGTTMVKEIAEGSLSSNPQQLTAVGDRVFFVADNSKTSGVVNGVELWVSDGSPAGTKMVKDIVVGPGSPDIQDLTSINGVAVFSANDGVNGREIWISDGTPVGTFMVRDLTNDSASSSPQELTNFGERLLYSARTYNFGQEPRLGNLDPEIAVEQPVDSPLTSGATVDFGAASLVNYKTLQFVIKNDGLNTLKSLSATLTGTDAKDFAIVTKPPLTLGPDAVFNLAIKFTPKLIGERLAILTIKSTDPDEGTFVINIKGTGENVFLDPLPGSQMAVVGDTVTFNVNVNPAGDAAPAIQWKKGGLIPGAIGDEYTINPVTLGHAGDYSVQAKVGTLIVTTPKESVAKLGVVDNTAKELVVAAGANATVKVDAKGSGLTFKWRRKFGLVEEDLTEGAHFKGVNKTSLMINKVVAGGQGVGDTATYFCEVTGPNPSVPAMVVGGTTVLKIFTGQPEITVGGFDPPDGIVSGFYSYDIVMNADPTLAATGFTAKGLPTGLKIDAKSGRIQGYPTKAGTYKITVTASNARGKAISNEAEVVIDAFPMELAGAYAGLVERDGELNQNMGGRFDLVITGTGTFTGSVTLGVTKYPLKGQIDVPVNYPLGTAPNATVLVKRTGGLRNLNVFFEIADNAIAGNSQVNDNPNPNGINLAPLTGWRQIWSTKAGAVPGAATAYEGYYTLGLKLSGGPTTLPQGWGYASFKVAKDGKLTVAGKTADGESITAAAFVGPGGEVPIFQPLYATKPKGSLLGQMTIGLGTDALAATDNTLGGLLDWLRPLDDRKTARTYNDGFGNTGMPVEVDIFGRAYGPVAKDTMVMGVTPGFGNVQVTLADGGVDLSNDPNPRTVIFDLGANNKVGIPKAPNNPSALTFTLNAATGVFGGSIVLVDDPNPRPPPAVLKRTVKFQGLIINDGTLEHGVGYFLLPQLGESLPSTVTNANSDILSGSVDFRKKP